MSLDPRTPVLVGAAAITQHVDDPIEASEPLELMAEALEAAARDAGAKALLTEVDAIYAPRGFWAYSNPGAILAERWGATGVRTVIAEVGILQTTVLGHAASAIARGKAEIVMIVGAEARDRASRLERRGDTVPLTSQEDSLPDDVLSPHAEIMGQFEIDLGLITPTIQYALIDNALRAAESQSIDAHQSELASLWGRFNDAAVANPDAWNRTPMTGVEICTPTKSNRLLAYPYTKSLVSQWNVNQSGGLILCSLAKAKSLGIPSHQFIYPHAVVDSEHMVTLSERRDLHRAPGFQFAADRASEVLGRQVAEIEHLELYSCFPAAVRVQQREMGIDPSRLATQIGGMTFGGGPLNNFVVQGWVKMIETLRAHPGESGLVSAISGLITKQGISILGPEPTQPFAHEFVTDEVAAAYKTIPVVREREGLATVASYTVSVERNAATGLVLVCDFEDGERTLRVVPDSDMAEVGQREELIGRSVELGADGAVRWP